MEKSRIYDDTKVKHFGGYPKSFVERLRQFQFFKLIYENKEMMIWEKSRGLQVISLIRVVTGPRRNWSLYKKYLFSSAQQRWRVFNRYVL